eukprot:1647622-Rhodomonas_salina.4
MGLNEGGGWIGEGRTMDSRRTMDRVREGMGGEWGENAQEGNCVCCGRRGRAGGERRLNTEDPRRRRKEGEGAGEEEERRRGSGGWKCDRKSGGQSWTG